MNLPNHAIQLIMPYLDIINACAYNVYQALNREPGDEATDPPTQAGILTADKFVVNNNCDKFIATVYFNVMNNQ